MTDLFTPTMPAELRTKLEDANAALMRVAEDIFEFLGRFFEDAWTECHQTHQAETFTIGKDGEKTTKTVTFKGTPDFNEFDRVTHRYEKAVSKLRWLLWDIDKAANPPADTTGASDAD